MDFNGPGTSLFQGGNINTFDSNTQREEEEEAIEEQKRRDIELKNILENAFNDVSFDNEDCSGMNIGLNHSNLNHEHKSPISSSDNIFKNSNYSFSEYGKNYAEEQVQDYYTPIRHTKSVKKTSDFKNHHETDNYSDQFRIKQQNGSLHDIVDASGGGGGGDAGISLHYNHCTRSNSFDKHNILPVQTLAPSQADEQAQSNKHYQNADYNSLEQLQILYDVRVREVHSLTELVDRMKNDYEIEKAELKRQLGLAAAEKERHKISQNELQNLLVAHKEDIEASRSEIESLKKAINNLEESKEGLLIELETSRATINNLERKLLAIEKGRKDKTLEMQYEANIQELKEKNAAVLMGITKELEICKINYETALKENEELKQKMIHMSQASDESLAKKSEIIQRLSRQIEETQEQCEKLMKNSVSEDNIKLQMELKILKEENAALASKIESLENNLTTQEMEIRQYESLSNFSAFDIKNSSDSQTDKDGEFSEINRKLREELFRALNSQKARRQEIQSLQGLIMKKDEQIHNMAEKERQFLVDAAKFREDIGKHIAELKSLENATAAKEAENKRLKDLVDDLKSELSKSVRESEMKWKMLQDENKSLSDELKILKENVEKEKIEVVSKYNEEYMRFHDDGLQRVREEMGESYRLEIMGKDMEIENLRKEIEEAKNLYVDVYNEKENLLNQLDKEKGGLSRSVDVDDVIKLQKELEKSRQRIHELDLTLRQQYQQEVEKLNMTIKCLNLEVEKLRRENAHGACEANKISQENQLLRSELEEATAEKNLYYLKCESMEKEMEKLRIDIERDNCKEKRSRSADDYDREFQDVRNRYEIKIQKLNKEIELMLAKSVSTESKYTSPMKSAVKIYKNAAVQGPVLPPVHSAATSPLYRSCTQDTSTSPLQEYRRDAKMSPLKGSNRDVSMVTDPEPKRISKREVIRIMEKLGAEHEEEINLLESKYKMELVKLEKKWQLEIESIKDKVRVEMMSLHVEELEELQEKHKIEMENRIEQEKKEAVVALITEWACEVQGLKQSHAEALAQAEKMKRKYKSAKNIALRYKNYFTIKVEQMREEWRKVEEGYENALKELEKNVHMLVDVREDEVKAKVRNITESYEEKIRKMRSKLDKYENLLRQEMKLDAGDAGASSKNSTDEKPSKSSASERGPDRLVVPDSRLCRKHKRREIVSSSSTGENQVPYAKSDDERGSAKRGESKKNLFLDESHFIVHNLLEEKRKTENSK